MSSAEEPAVIDGAIARVRAGEALAGSFMHEHGLESPVVACSALRFEGGAFVFESWLEEPVVPVVRFNAQSRALDEAGAREVLGSDRPLRAALGLA